MNEPLRQLTDAIAAYNIQLLAHAHDDSSPLANVRRALAPIDKFRQAQQGRRGAGVPVDAPPPEAPTPAPPSPEG